MSRKCLFFPPLPPLLERVFLAVEQAFHSLSILIKKVIWKWVCSAWQYLNLFWKQKILQKQGTGTREWNIREGVLARLNKHIPDCIKEEFSERRVTSGINRKQRWGAKRIAQRKLSLTLMTCWGLKVIWALLKVARDNRSLRYLRQVLWKPGKKMYTHTHTPQRKQKQRKNV